MPLTPKTSTYVRQLERNAKKLSATLRYFERKHRRTTTTLNHTIVTLYEENKSLAADNKSLAANLKSLTTRAAANSQIAPKVTPKRPIKSRFDLSPRSRRAPLSPTEICFRPNGPPFFGTAINEYGTNINSPLLPLDI